MICKKCGSEFVLLPYHLGYGEKRALCHSCLRRRQFSMFDMVALKVNRPGFSPNNMNWIVEAKAGDYLMVHSYDSVHDRYALVGNGWLFWAKAEDM